VAQVLGHPGTGIGFSALTRALPTVAAWHPQPGEQDRGDHPRHLADYFAEIPAAQAGHQHQPVDVGVPASQPLGRKRLERASRCWQRFETVLGSRLDERVSEAALEVLTS
jgi:hypothetical protein